MMSLVTQVKVKASNLRRETSKRNGRTFFRTPTTGYQRNWLTVIVTEQRWLRYFFELINDVTDGNGIC